MAETQSIALAPSGPSLRLIAIATLVLSFAGAGAGWYIGAMLLAPAIPVPAAEPAPDPQATQAQVAEAGRRNGHGEEQLGENGHGEAAATSGSQGASADAHGEKPVATSGSMVSLEPVVVNLAAPADVWVRLEAVLKLSEPVEIGVAEEIHDDYMAFFRTLRLRELQGASAFGDLRAELLDRARIRSRDRVAAVYIKTFLFE